MRAAMSSEHGDLPTGLADRLRNRLATIRARMTPSAREAIEEILRRSAGQPPPMTGDPDVFMAASIELAVCVLLNGEINAHSIPAAERFLDQLSVLVDRQPTLNGTKPIS